MQQTRTLESTTALRPATAPVVPEFEIVPVKALPIIGVVIVALVAAIEYNRLWPLEFFHIVGGGMWTAIDLFVGFIIGPILGRLSVQARIEFLTRFMPKMVLLMPTLVTVTLVAGWQLANYTGDIAVTYPDHWWLTASYMVVGVMSLIAIGVLEPANLAVLFELKKPVPNGELIGRLMRRFVYTAGITGVMQVATLIIMTRIATW
ncbi:MAG TPA: hypothetical protein VIB47_00465 [Dehalococcoidia bacterium]|jgi:hypothetical protein